ncbi:MAG: hypothetical protein NC084_06385 [Bacteroides sp.]|nr:hypothetical protein [Eubacterium sp.]MCM1418148.1 hypothetical protein [Roseburia sp.]MCM1462327.1 hypothetical protein [Bacteroides sp.]
MERVKIVQPAMCEVYNGRMARAFAKIIYEDERLSISGVIGPKSNGNCTGSCGQCREEIAAGTPAVGWTKEMLKQFSEIWERWHLNDLRPSCEHQRALGWEDEAQEAITIYRYCLTDEAGRKQKEAEKAALTALKNGKSFTPTEEQSMYASLPYTVKSFGKELDLPDYRPVRPLYAGDKGATSKERRGWIRYDEDPIGILCKPCPMCGYRYGTSWKKEEIPQEVIDWLFSLPDSPIEPAWV